MSELILLDSGPSENGWHRCEEGLHCPQFYAYRHLIGGIQEPQADKRVRGTIGHVGLAHYFRRMQAEQTGEDKELYYEPLEAMGLMADKLGDLGRAMIGEASRAVAKYLEAEAHQLRDWKIIAVEQPVAAEIGWPPRLEALRESRHGQRYPITARLDLVAAWPDGGVRIIDHKIVSHIQSKVHSRYVLSGQFLLQQWFGHAMFGERFRGAYVNLMTPAGKHELTEVGPAPFLLQQLPQIICDGNERLRDLVQESRDPWDYPKAAHETGCITPYGLCDYYDYCRWGKNT